MVPSLKADQKKVVPVPEIVETGSSVAWIT